MTKKVEVGPAPYNRKRIAWELERTAMGDGYYGNALRAAKDFPEATPVVRSLLDRWATGKESGLSDRTDLCAFALQIYAAGGESPQPPAEAQPRGRGCGDHDHASYIPGCGLCAATLPEKRMEAPPSAPVGVEGRRVLAFALESAYASGQDGDAFPFRSCEQKVLAALAQQPAAVDDLNAWREAFIAERATRYRERGMAIEQARIHAETDAARIDAQQGGA